MLGRLSMSRSEGIGWAGGARRGRTAVSLLGFCASLVGPSPALARDAGTPNPNAPAPSPSSASTTGSGEASASGNPGAPSPAAEGARPAESAPREAAPRDAPVAPAPTGAGAGAAEAPRARDEEVVGEAYGVGRDPASNTERSRSDELDFDDEPLEDSRGQRAEPRSESPAPPKMGDVIGRVVRVKEGTIVVSRDTKNSLRPGDNVGFRDEFGDERVVGRIRRVNLSTYDVHVQMNEEVNVGELGYLTPSPPSGRLVAPPLGNFAGSFGLTVKPWLGLNGRDSGALLEGFLRVQVANHLRLSGEVQPASPAIGNTPGMVEAFVAPSVTFRLAEIGFGAGVGSANHNPTYYADGRTFPGQPELGVLLTPFLGIGAEDGLKMRARSSAVVHSGRATFGSFRIDIEIPVSYGMRLVAGGGGGDSGYSYGEVGFKMLVAGNGGGKSWIAHGLFGYGGTHAEEYDANFAYVRRSADGPYLGLGFEYRFGKRPGDRE